MWYAIQVFSGMEEKSKELIYRMVDRDCFNDCFVIKFEKSRKYMGEWHREKNVLFPGYVFIDTVVPSTVYDELKKVPRLTKVLGRELGEFYPVREEEEAVLRKLLGFGHTIEMSVGYIEGDRIIISSGALANKEGMIKKIDRHKRTALISIEMFGQVVDTTIGLEIISKI